MKVHLLAAFILCFSFAVSAQENTVASTETKKKGKPEKEYFIYDKGTMINKLTVRKDDKSAGNIVEIEALNISGGSISLGKGNGNYAGSVLPPATIGDIVSLQGNYQSARALSKSGRGVVLQLLDVTFPYRARTDISGQVLEFEIKEPGFWKINIGVTQ